MTFTFCREFVILAVPDKLPQLFGNFPYFCHVMQFSAMFCCSNRRMSNLVSVFQAINSPSSSTPRTKHRALILCQNIAVPKTSLYCTVFHTQKSLNIFFVNCYNTCTVFTHILRIFPKFFCDFSRKIAAFLTQFSARTPGRKENELTLKI